MDAEKVIAAIDKCVAQECDGCGYSNSNVCIDHLMSDAKKVIEQFRERLKV